MRRRNEKLLDMILTAWKWKLVVETVACSVWGSTVSVSVKVDYSQAAVMFHFPTRVEAVEMSRHMESTDHKVEGRPSATQRATHTAAMPCRTKLPSHYPQARITQFGRYIARPHYFICAKFHDQILIGRPSKSRSRETTPSETVFSRWCGHPSWASCSVVQLFHSTTLHVTVVAVDSLLESRL